MQIAISASTAKLNAGTRQAIERRIRLALSRFQSRLVQIAVELAESPREGGEQLCRVTVQFSPTGKMTVTAIDRQRQACLDRAIERTRQALDRKFDPCVWPPPASSPQNVSRRR
ncbi:MAG: hypothetical protein SFX18_07110 [Pirellulales bacterium]|nr:hypothetical protein [Pirellulales bacterium]